MSFTILFVQYSFVVNYLGFVLRDSKKFIFRIGSNLRKKMKTVLYTISND